jgi:Zn-dependent protease with chaperone function
MPFLLIVFLTLVCLPDENDWPVPSWLASATVSATLTAAAALAVAGYAWWLSRRTRLALRADPGSRDVALARYERSRSIHHGLVFAAFTASLFLFGWGRTAYWLWGAGTGHAWPEVGATPWFGAEFYLLSPFLLSLLFSWVSFYDADRAAHIAAHRIFGVDPASRSWLDQNAPVLEPLIPFGGRPGYVVFQLRQRLALVFIPLSLLLALKEVRRHVHQSVAAWEFGIIGVGVFIVGFGMPWLMRLALGLKSMPPGPLRDRLFAAARRLRFRFSDVLMWHTRGGMANAMVVGLLPWPRYVVLTDRLVDDFRPEEVEAVFGHEVGHIKHRHMLYYLGFLSVSILVLSQALERLEPVLRQVPAVAYFMDVAFGQSPELVRMVPVAGLMLAYVFVVFGFLSRRCERQADVYGCRAVSCTHAGCTGHDNGDNLSDQASGLCPTGILTFVRALDRVAAVNGIDRDRPGFLQSWQHSTIARRVTFLRGLLADPGEEERFQHRVTAVKWGLFACLGLLLGLVVYFGGPATAHEGDAPTATPAAPPQRNDDRPDPRS